MVVVRKRLKTTKTEAARRDYDREKECLELLRLLRHPNVLELLASYTYRGEYNFLFPRLNMDLEQFLALEDSFGDFKQNLTYIRAIEGLSSALESIHNLHLNPTDDNVDISRIGYHHDLRPRNILVTSYTFLLADFGLSRFKVANANSRTKWRENMGDYIAPECMNQDFEPQDVGRAIDIWAFGGIIIDVAWYCEQGPKGVEKARSARQGPEDKNKWDNQCFFLGDKVKPNAILSAKGLRDHAKDETTAGLIKLAFSMLQIPPQERPVAAAVHRNMEFLAVKSLFHTLRTTLRDYAKCLLDEDREEQVPSLTKYWFEVRRLDVWASVLAINSDGLIPKDFGEAADAKEGNVRLFQDVLSDIMNTFNDLSLSKNQALSTSLSMPDHAVASYEERHELLHQLVEKLWTSLVGPSRKRINRVWQQLSLEIDYPNVLKAREVAVQTANNVQHRVTGGAPSSEAQASFTTYRVQCLPAHCTWKSTRSLIASAVGCFDDKYDIVVHSLAYSVGYDGEKTATISSDGLSKKLQGPRNRWTFTLTDQTYDSEDGRPRYQEIVIDTHFEGLTPLNCFETQEDHRLE